MSFIGAVSAPVRNVLANFAKDIQGPAHIVGDGNFTVPSVLRSGGFKGDMFCCDVSLYTSVLGAYLADGDIQISEKEECPDQLKGLFRSGSPAEIVASVALLYDLRDVWKVTNPYQERMVGEYRSHWDELLKKTIEKLEAYKKHIGKVDYQPKCGWQYLTDLDRDNTIFMFPPTYKAGYEKFEKLLRVTLEWDPPDYAMMTDKDMKLYRLISEFRDYFVVLEKDLPEAHDIIGKPSVILPRGRSAFSHIITRQPKKHSIIVRPETKSANIGSFWPVDREIEGTENLEVEQISLAQSIRMNELFISKRINYFKSMSGISLAFRLDGQVIGKADFTLTTHRWKLPDDKPMIYIMSDLAVPSNVENRLVKLVLHCMLSKEVKEILDLKYIEDFAWACTTAFSRHPASMKYRGLFKLHKRMEPKDGGRGYSLNYYAPFGAHSMSQVLEMWRKKYKKNK